MDNLKESRTLISNNWIDCGHIIFREFVRFDKKNTNLGQNCSYFNKFDLSESKIQELSLRINGCVALLIFRSEKKLLSCWP